MGSYIYCDECEQSGKAVWDMTTEEILSFIVLDDFELRCDDCDNILNYDRSQFVTELAERIDNNDAT